MPISNVHPQLGGTLVQDLLKAQLRHRQKIERVVVECGHIQRQRAKEEPRGRLANVGIPGQPLIQASPVEHPDHLTDQPVRTDLVGGLRSRSSTTGRTPAKLSSQANINPLGPPPTITTSQTTTPPRDSFS